VLAWLGEEKVDTSYPMQIDHPPKVLITWVIIEGRTAARQDIVLCWLHRVFREIKKKLLLCRHLICCRGNRAWSNI